MSAISELAEAVGGLIEQINEAATNVGALHQQTEETIESAINLGSESAAAILGQAKEALDNLAGQLTAASSSAEEIQTTINGAGSGDGGT